MKTLDSTYTPPVHIQIRLLKLAALFLFIYSLALTFSPAARARSWDVDLNWSHWLGFIAWLFVIIIIQQQVSKYLPDSDPYILASALLLIGLGILTIWRLDSGFGLRQTMWLIVCALFFIAGIRYSNTINILYQYKYIFLFTGLLLTGLTLFFGTNPGGGGSHLWLGCCGIYLQPSEPLKLLLVVYLAAFLADRVPIQTKLLPLLLPSLFLTGLAISILLTQRDLGTASIFIFIYTAMSFLATGKRRLLIISLILLITTVLVGYFFVDIIRYRLIAWIDPWSDPSGRSYQVIQSILAVSNGGFYGSGPGMGSPSLVPVAHSDFIFTSISEETGLIGTFALLVTLGLITMRGFIIAMHAENNFRRLLSAGIACYFCTQSIVIIGGNLRLLPLTGVTLPFVSYGGSSLLTSFIGLLILTLISNEKEKEPAVLIDPRPYLMMAGLLGAGILACGTVNGWWAVIRADDLLSRTDNPRRAIADRFVLRGAILDRQNRVINITTGQPGTFIRNYRVPDLSAIVGYTHPVYGQAGLEASFDPYLRGLKGNPESLIQWDHLLYDQPPNGLNLRLSLDLDLQKKADELIGKHTGALILVNAQTGEILAMSSHPNFDANQLDTIEETLPGFLNAPMVNRATQGKYPIKNALKPFLSAAFGISDPSVSELITLYSKMGFYNPLEINMSVAPAMESGTEENIAISPIQLIPPVAALSNSGLCPALIIGSAVETTSQGWEILPRNGESSQCLSKEGSNRVTGSLQVEGQPFWEYSESNIENKQSNSWYIAGTIPQWAGTHLALVIVLEDSSPILIKNIGRTMMQQTMQP